MKRTTKKNSRFGPGWMPDLPDNRDHLYSAPLAKLRVLPTKADLRRRCPRIYNQGEIGSCTANAIAAAIEFDRKKQKLRDFIPSRLFIYFNERSIEHSIPLDNGAQIRDGIKSVAKQGACPETQVTLRRYSGRSDHKSLACRSQTAAKTIGGLLQGGKNSARELSAS